MKRDCIAEVKLLSTVSVVVLRDTSLALSYDPDTDKWAVFENADCPEDFALGPTAEEALDIARWEIADRLAKRDPGPTSDRAVAARQAFGELCLRLAKKGE